MTTQWAVMLVLLLGIAFFFAGSSANPDVLVVDEEDDDVKFAHDIDEEILYHEKHHEGERLRAVLVLTRHGDRTPVKLFPNTKSKWPEGLGQLTPLGMQQHFELGSKFRRKYVEEAKLFGPDFNTHEVYARSSSKDRTLMSAQSFMHGLFPPGEGPDEMPMNLQVVPIHAYGTEEDNILLGYKNCPTLHKLTDHIRKGPEWKEMEEKTADIRAQLSEIFGFNVKLKHMNSINTILRCEDTHQREMLAGVTPEMREALIETTDWLFKYKFSHPDMGRMAGGNLLHEISLVLGRQIIPKEDVAKGERKLGPKFTLFSAHDGTILALFAAMGAKNFTVPKYAEYLHFELYEKPTLEGDQQFNVRMYYNDEPLAVHECPHTCSYAQFSKWAKEVRHDDWHDACGISKTKLWFMHLMEELAFMATTSKEMATGAVLGMVMGVAMTSALLCMGRLRSNLGKKQK